MSKIKNLIYLHLCPPDGVHGERDLRLHVPLVLGRVPGAPAGSLLHPATAVVRPGDAQLDDAWGSIQ